MRQVSFSTVIILLESLIRPIRMKPRKILNLIGIFCCGIFFVSSNLPCAAGESRKEKSPIEASAAVDKASMLIGDKATYTITVKAPKDIEVEFPQILPENLAGFAIKDFGSLEKGLFGKRTLKQWYLLDTYAGGQQVIPQAVVKYRAKGSTDWQELSVNEVKLEVKSVLNADPAREDIRDIRGPKSFAGKMRLYVLIALAALLIIAALISSLLLKKRKEGPKAPPVPAHIIAYAALAALEKKDYLRKGQVQAYYIELSGIARRYLENRFNIRAPEMTTEEFLNNVKENNALSPEHKGLLRDFLSACDLVKFAKYQPVQEEANLSFDAAKKLIDQTRVGTEQCSVPTD